MLGERKTPGFFFEAGEGGRRDEPEMRHGSSGFTVFLSLVYPYIVYAVVSMVVLNLEGVAVSLRRQTSKGDLVVSFHVN